jgi:hypothetical protein
VEEDQFGNRGLVVRGAVSGHVKRSLFAEFPCLLQASKTVSQQESCLIILGIGKEKTITEWRVWAKVERLERGRDNGTGHRLRCNWGTER